MLTSACGKWPPIGSRVRVTASGVAKTCHRNIPGKFVVGTVIGMTQADTCVVDHDDGNRSWWGDPASLELAWNPKAGELVVLGGVFVTNPGSPMARQVGKVGPVVIPRGAAAKPGIVQVELRLTGERRPQLWSWPVCDVRWVRSEVIEMYRRASRVHQALADRGLWDLQKVDETTETLDYLVAEVERLAAL